MTASPVRRAVNLCAVAMLAWPALPGGTGLRALQRHGRTGFAYDDAYLTHDTGVSHPERPDRLLALVDHLEAKGILPKLTRLAPRPAPLKWIGTVHTRSYISEVKRACEDGTRYMHSMDTPISARSYEVARLAAGGVLAAIDAVANGKVRNAFCAVRPPGHHALPAKATGFCLFNNVAIGARYAQKTHGLKKVLIVDWDVHHGNGTQDAFYDDPTVLFFSTHQPPFYPGTGSQDERGAGRGEGYTLNVPLSAGTGDRELLQVFRQTLLPRALAFDPDLVLISAGFDAHEDDSLGGMQVTTEGFVQLTSVVREIADRCCDGRLVSVLEGGYDLDALSESVAAHLATLLQPS